MPCHNLQQEVLLPVLPNDAVSTEDATDAVLTQLFCYPLTTVSAQKLQPHNSHGH